MPDQTLEDKIRQISLDRDNGDLLLEEVVQQIQSIISFEIRKEKIKMLEGLKYDDFLASTPKDADWMEKGICYERREVNRIIDKLISQLKQEEDKG